MPAHFGAKLRRLREHNRLTKTTLAQRIGLASHAHIVRLEAGQDRPSLDLVIRIASLFGVTTDYLLRDTIPVEAIQLTVHESVGGIDAGALGMRVRALRKRHGLQQVALAQRLDRAGQSGIGKIERGEKLPSLERLEKIADVFEVSIDSLLFG
jgi:transcriptional regulator with XRE-family HTH domain